MKVFTLFFMRKVGLMLAALMLTSISYAAIFVATTSGNFSSSATWAGGLVPPTMLTVDIIIISPGVTVNLDNNLTCNGILAQLDVQGTLNTNTNATLTLGQCSLTGGGAIVLNNIDINTGATLLFTGSMTANTINITTACLSSADFVANQTLNLATGILTLAAGGSLDVGTDGTIIRAGGSIVVGVGGSVDLSGNYNVTYSNSSCSSGIELSGQGLTHVNVNVNSGNAVTLTSDITIDGTLSLNSGSLILSGHDLIINGDVSASGNGTITTTASSDIHINCPDGTTGDIRFVAGAAVNNLICNVGSGNHGHIEGNVTVNGSLQLNSGILNCDNTNLIIGGNVSGAGLLSCNNLTNLSVNTAGGLSTALNFAAGGQTLHNLNISVGAGNSVTLGSNLTVNGILSLNNGCLLNLNGKSLTLDLESSISGTGSLVCTPASNLNIHSVAGVPSLNLQGTIGNMEMDCGESNLVLGANATIGGMLSLESGALMLNGYDLSVNGTVDVSGSGVIVSTASSDININCPNGTTGDIRFGAGAAVNNLICNVGSGNHGHISGNLMVNGTLQLNTGILNCDNTNLTINGSVSGTGLLSGNTSTNLAVNTAGGLSAAVAFAAGGQVINNLSLSVGSGNSVSLGSDLSVHGMINLQGGSMLDLNGKSLTLDLTGSVTGTGSLMCDPASSLNINATAGIPSLNTIGTIGNLLVNCGSGSVGLAANTTISGALNLQSGSLMLNGHALTLNGTVAASGTGTIISTSTSDIHINCQGGTTGTIRFDPGSIVNNLICNVGAGNQGHIGGSITVNGTLHLNSGILSCDNTNLTIGGNIMGMGHLSGNSLTNLTITTAGGLSTALTFAAGGQSLNHLNLLIGSGNSVSLGSDLTVHGILALDNGCILNLNGKSLTLDLASTISGTGSLACDPSSNLMIHSATGISSLITTGAVGNLMINSGGNVTLGSNITVAGMLHLQGGALMLNGHGLTINGNIAASGNGTISSDANADITIATQGSPTGICHFTPGANTVRNLIINIGGNGTVNIGSSLTVNSNLHFNSGRIDIGSNALILDPACTVTGAGVNSYIITDIGGHVEMDMTAGGGTSTFPVGTDICFAPALLSLNPGSGSGKVQVGVVTNVLAHGTSGNDLSETLPIVDATWHVQSGISGNIDIDVKAMWPATCEVNGFNRNDAFIAHYTNGKWDSSARMPATAEADGMFSLERTGLASLGAFAVFDANTVVAVDDVTEGLLLKVFPNPTVDNIVIQSSAITGDPVNMVIYNSTGQMVGQYKLTEPMSTVSLQDLMNGNYWIKFYNKDMKRTKQITKI